MLLKLESLNIDYDALPKGIEISELSGAIITNSLNLNLLFKDQISHSHTFSLKEDDSPEFEDYPDMIDFLDENLSYSEKANFFTTCKYTGAYGVCDTPQQIFDKIPILKKSSKKFVVICTPIRKKDQPKEGGWRWHKWGEYIGLQEPKYEYLYDEKDIDLVYVYSIYVMKG